MAFRVLTRFSSLLSRNCLRLLQSPLHLRSYSSGDDRIQDVTDVQMEQPALRYTRDLHVEVTGL